MDYFKSTIPRHIYSSRPRNSAAAMQHENSSIGCNAQSHDPPGASGPSTCISQVHSKRDDWSRKERSWVRTTRAGATMLFKRVIFSRALHVRRRCTEAVRVYLSAAWCHRWAPISGNSELQSCFDMTSVPPLATSGARVDPFAEKGSLGSQISCADLLQGAHGALSRPHELPSERR